MAKREILAYLAGLCDGEGYVGIKKSKPHNGRVAPSYHERIQIRMVDERAIHLFAETLGGSYYAERAPKLGRRGLFCYQASDLIALNALKTILPWLRIKADNARLVCELRVCKDNPTFEMVEVTMMSRWKRPMKIGRRRFSAAMLAKMESLYLECKRLNHAH